MTEPEQKFSAAFSEAMERVKQAREPTAPAPQKHDRVLRRSVLVQRDLPMTSMNAVCLLGAVSMTNGVTK